MPAFSNHPVPADELPDYRLAELTPVDSAYTLYAVLKNTALGLQLSAASAIPLFLERLEYQPGLTGILLLFSVGLALLGRFDARRRSWALREHDLIYRSGVFWRRTVIIPFARIQHVESSSGPLERRLGLLRLRCFTAGGNRSDLTVYGLSLNDGNKVLVYLLEQIRGSDTASAIEPDLPHDADA